MSITIVSCVWGDHERFIPSWRESIAQLETPPDDVILKTGWIDWTDWKHRQAGFLDQAIREATTDYVWILDVDDVAIPTALNDLDLHADVHLCGYVMLNGSVYIPDAMANEDYLGAGNPYPGASIIRVAAYKDVGGFYDIAFQDWGLWRRMARADCSFVSTGRACYVYCQHELSRTNNDLKGKRQENWEDLLDHEREIEGADYKH